jgi:hypothetical protein
MVLEFAALLFATESFRLTPSEWMKSELDERVSGDAAFDRLGRVVTGVSTPLTHSQAWAPAAHAHADLHNKGGG